MKRTPRPGRFSLFSSLITHMVFCRVYLSFWTITAPTRDCPATPAAPDRGGLSPRILTGHPGIAYARARTVLATDTFQRARTSQLSVSLSHKVTLYVSLFREARSAGIYAHTTHRHTHTTHLHTDTRTCALWRRSLGPRLVLVPRGGDSRCLSLTVSGLVSDWRGLARTCGKHNQ